ncbi:MAG TPA: ABC transporter ATP-binding protein [Bryobacteraceae bacterium]|jgi:ABC-type polysaccharide/polyol phosphate transport system ATPase subunit
MPAVEVAGISKYYALGNSQWSRVRRIFSPGSHTSDEVCALRDVSFTVAEGEAFGIIGSNGSGKSTLLQIIAGILRPSAGSVTVNGRCSTLLELGSGFAPEFTGRQNVYLNATILGLSEEDIDTKFASIERFADIGEFIDQPIRTYSTGMVLRLAFAVIAHSDPRLLIVDEALAVGDVAFRQRCMRRIHELRAQGVTILYVSHDTADVKALCERCLWLDRGVVRGLGEADEIVARYLASTLEGGRSPEVAEPSAIPQTVTGTHRFGNGAAQIIGVSLPPASSKREAFLRLRIRSVRTVTAPIAGFLVRNQKGESIFGTNSARENHPLIALQPNDERTVDFRITMPRLAPGRYSISVAVSDGSIGEFEVCDYIEDAIEFDSAQFDALAEIRPVSGYVELPCSAVAIHKH